MGVSDGTPRKLARSGNPCLKDIPSSPWTLFEFGGEKNALSRYDLGL